MAMLDDIKAELGADFTTGDDTVLSNIISRVQSTALSIANRANTTTNVTLLTPEIFECAKTIYLQRGTEDVSERSAQGDESVYKDAYAVLKQNIVRAGKRLLR